MPVFLKCVNFSKIVGNIAGFTNVMGQYVFELNHKSLSWCIHGDVARMLMVRVALKRGKKVSFLIFRRFSNESNGLN